ncbi:Heat shock protein DnaJ N-terminal [Penicillium chermesinum]|nr:Heat shock protein DnaJ N-terminal [Penicillium chermesinum]
MTSKPRCVDFYEVLGVSPNANSKDIDTAYKKQALKYHPDKIGDGNEELFQRIQEAGEILRDPRRRERYDVELKNDREASTTRAHARDPSRHHNTYDAYAYSHGNSVHMSPDSFESREEKARHMNDLPDWEMQWAGIDPEVERARDEIEENKLRTPTPSNINRKVAEGKDLPFGIESISPDAYIAELGMEAQYATTNLPSKPPNELLQILQPFVDAKLECGKGRYTKEDLLGELQGAVRDATPLHHVRKSASLGSLCSHSGSWNKSYGQLECKKCHLWRPFYNQICSECGLEACVRCRSLL